MPITQRRQVLASLIGVAAFGRPGFVCAQTPVAVPGTDVAPEIDALLADQSLDPPFAGAALIAIDGKTVLDTAYGYADGLTRRPNTTNTGFQIASVTKTFTATQIVQLRDAGAFDLDTPAAELIPRFADQLGSGETPVTVRHLLMHTSGVPDFLELYDVFDVEHYPETLDQLLDRIAGEPLRFGPGSEFHYSNSGYLYLGRIIEAVTGEPWEAALADRITRPLGLRHTWLTPGEDRGPRATGYLKVQGLVLPVSRFGRPDLAESAGGLTSRTHDLLAWLDAFFAGEVVAPDSVCEMLEPGPHNYGLGWESYNVEGDHWYGHFGETIGYRAALFRQPERNASIVLLCNRQDHPIVATTNRIFELIATA